MLSFVGCAHWRTVCSAAGCQGPNRAASEVRLRGEINLLVRYSEVLSPTTVMSNMEFALYIQHIKHISFKLKYIEIVFYRSFIQNFKFYETLP